MKNKVLVYGYKNLNLGDDLFFSILFKRYPNTKFFFLGSSKYKAIFKNQKNVIVISPHSVKDYFIATVAKFFNESECSFLDKIVDYRVLITGSGFGECSQELFQKYKPKSNQKLLIIGANFGPYFTESFMHLCEDYFARCLDVCFRDMSSYNLFSNLPNIRYAPDIVFNISNQYNVHNLTLKKLGSHNLLSQKYAVISVISFKRRNKNINAQIAYLEKIKFISNFLISKGIKLVFMSFCEAEGDCDSVQMVLNDKQIAQHSWSYTYRGDINQALAIISHADAVIATRFHSMILGFVYKKKVLPIVYDSKMSNTLKDLNFQYKIDAISEEKITLYDLEDWFNNYSLPELDNIVIESQNHFSILDDVLK